MWSTYQHWKTFAMFSPISRSSCNCSWPVLVLMTRYNKQSSANKRALDFIISGRSLMKNRNSSGPKTVPWGTSESTELEWVPSRSTCSVRSCKKCCIYCSVLSCIPYSFSLRSSRWCGTLSKAFEKSNNTASICFPSDKIFARSWIVVISWVSQDLRALKPCWQSDRIWYVDRWSIMLLHIICSCILQQMAFRETGL